jgi:hypothetical protein
MEQRGKTEGNVWYTKMKKEGRRPKENRERIQMCRIHRPADKMWIERRDEGAGTRGAEETPCRILGKADPNVRGPR